jgi:hypothetical protein
MSVRLTVASVALAAASLLPLAGAAFATTPTGSHQVATDRPPYCDPNPVVPCPHGGKGYDPNDPHDNPDGAKHGK